MMQKKCRDFAISALFVCDYILDIAIRSGMQQDERASARKLRPTAL